ncbi:TPA: hypothetical protein SIF69_004123 [Escherichia coli]|nr:hypothetical protein [Escherichia coli]
MVNKKINRSEAIAEGQKVYWREKPCPKGHSGWFRIGGGCVECQKISSNRYKSENKDELKQKRKNYLESEKGKEVYSEWWENKGKEAAATRRRERWVADEEYREKQLKISRNYKTENKDDLSEKRKKYLSNPEIKLKTKERQRKYQDENREKIRESRREYYRNYMRERRKNDPNFKVLTRMRDFNRRCIEAIKGVKNWRTKEELGYTPEEMRKHIESLWLENMSWENYGEWHIDHIKSIKSFIDDGVTDIKIINALTNLQPLWAFDNLSKGA